MREARMDGFMGGKGSEAFKVLGRWQEVRFYKKDGCFFSRLEVLHRISFIDWNFQLFQVFPLFRFVAFISPGS